MDVQSVAGRVNVEERPRGMGSGCEVLRKGEVGERPEAWAPWM